MGGAPSGGPFTVIRASGTDAYNAFIAKQGSIYKDRASAMDTERAAKIRLSRAATSGTT